MDLMNFKPTSDTVEVILRHPETDEPFCNDDGSEMTITVFAPHSKEYKAALYKQTNKRIQNAAKKGRSDITAEDLETSALTLISETVKAWDITYGGGKPALTEKLAKEVFSEVFWIREQVEEAVATTEFFTRG